MRRFATGIDHHVFEALFTDGQTIVIRMGRPGQRATLSNGLQLNRQLRPLGVPLPSVVAAGLDDPCPWIALERLPGTDLVHTIATLSDQQLRALAETIAAAQSSVGRVGSAQRYGYAATPAAAPHPRWSDVLEANLARSRTRIAKAALFDPGPVNTVAELISQRRDELDARASLGKVESPSRAKMLAQTMV